MRTAFAKYPDEGRGFEKGGPKRGLRRALPMLLIGVLLLGGGALMAKALYIPVKAQVAQVLLDRAFTASVDQGQPVKPWSWADTAPMARVNVPALDVSEIVLDGGSGEAMAFGPTAIVDNPASRVTVLAAHRDTHFEFIRDLNVGDAIEMERIDGNTARYRVTGLQTVRWDEFTYPADGGHGLLALTTCFPFDTDISGPLRRVAWARRIG